MDIVVFPWLFFVFVGFVDFRVGFLGFVPGEDAESDPLILQDL
tara:strand:+ start:455 stop:583 length:129 start_codon:yes stop_codon:yes gene_type:complete